MADDDLRGAILASEYAKQEGVGTDAIVKRIQRGRLRGRKVQDRWYVLVPDVTLDEPGLPALAGDQMPDTMHQHPLVRWLLARNETLNRENGELRNQVRELRRTLAAYHAVDEDRKRRAVQGDSGTGC